MQLTSTFHSLLHRFRSVFTAPTFATFLSIATGWCLSHRHRYVTEMIQSSGAVHLGHHSRYHRFFGNAAWSIDDLFESLARQAIATFSPKLAPEQMSGTHPSSSCAHSASAKQLSRKAT